jgi:signal transduction histidine kinase
LNNVARHSGSKKARVRLHFAQSSLELEIADSGTGFAESPARRGLGLVAMRERAELLGGSIRFEPAPGGGTVVKLEVPRETVSREAQEMHA